MRPTLVLTFVLGLCPAAAGFAQTVLTNSPGDAVQAGTTPFAVQGTVLDPTGAPIAAARVRVVPNAPGAPASTQTDHQGQFALALSPGAFTLTISAPGFVDEVLTLRAERIGTLPTRVRASSGRSARNRQSRRNGTVSDPSDDERHQDVHTAARHPAVGERRHQHAHR